MINLLNKNTYGFRTTKTAPQSPLLNQFEEELYNLVSKLEFQTNKNKFQKELATTVRKIKSSPNVLVFADKTSNIYQVTPEKYNQLLLNNITKTTK